jgi:7-cyano-7-deazaguanine synthase in queuosine biosynthesis
MKTWHIIIKQDEKESFDVNCPKGEEKITIPTVSYDNDTMAVNTRYVFEHLKNNPEIIPLSNTYDLLCIALGIYTADQIISRNDGYQGWSRHFKVYLPVTSIDEWTPFRENFQNLLSFLSGDKWEVFFRTVITSYKPEYSKRVNKKGIQVVSLFSGGLDSYISAIDLLETNKKAAFISHYKGGQESKVQVKMHDVLKRQYGKDSFEEFQFYVQPNQKHKQAQKENTSRARSFLFLCLGTTIANGYGDGIDLIIPENGLISLNVPLTGTRLSSHSTRTTHPYYLTEFSSLLNQLGIKNKLHNPYQFLTKGEMMIQCKNQVLLKKSYKDTLSCSHPDNSRFNSKPPGMHCGYCVPCIIRQASEKKSKLSLTEYDWNIKTKPPEQTSGTGSDLRAFKIALERLKDKKDYSILMSIMSVGPLPFIDKQELDNYVAIYKRGMKEVKDFLN